MVQAIGFAPSAHGFEVTHLTPNRAIRITRNELAQDGALLQRRPEQTYSSGVSTNTLASFTSPIDLAIDGVSPISMTAVASGDRFIRVRLSSAERAQCLTEGDFQVDVAVTGPPANTLASADGGLLQVLTLNAPFQRSTGGRCPRDLIYSYSVDLGVDDATSADAYVGDFEIAVTDSGGNVQVVSSQLTVDMPSVLLLYHFDRINIDVLAAALSEVVVPGGADMGTASLSMVSLGLPIDANIGGVAPPVGVLMPTVTLQNVVGARAIGCGGGVYAAASFDVTNALGGILPATGTISDIQGRTCDFNLATGDVQFQIDLNAVAFGGGTAQASAEILITVTGL